MSVQHLQVRGMSCAACQSHVEQALAAVPGVRSAQVDLMSHRASVTTETPVTPEQLTSAIRRAGYEASPAADVPLRDTAQSDSERWLGVRAVAALCAGALAMLLSMPLMMNGTTSLADPLSRLLATSMQPLMPHALLHSSPEAFRLVLCGLTLLVVLFAAPDVYSAAWRAARHRSTNMNTLVALGTVVAFTTSALATFAPHWSALHGLGNDVYFEAVDLILAFLLAGRWLDARARGRATAAVQGFAALQPAEARLLTVSTNPSLEELTSAAETVLPVDALAVGDFLRVLPGERVPVDAVIRFGRSSVDESLITGEPLPAARTSGDRVLGGTLNLDGVLVVRATAVGTDSTVAQMERLLADAQSQRAPMQRLADRVSAVFVPAVLLMALLTFLLWFAVLHANPQTAALGRSLQAAISVLVVACPCAMGLAVPAAVTVAIGSGARCGLLIKGGEVLERLAAVDTCALDKTGTLTEGRPHIDSVQFAPTARFSPETVLAWAAAVERLSTHPLAGAVVQISAATIAAETPLVSEFQVLPGTGVRARVGAHTIAIGSAAVLPESHGLPEETATPAAASTPLYVVLDGQLAASLYATDTIRDTAAGAMSQLVKLGASTLMLTGDIESSAGVVAKQAGITDLRAHLLPSEKVREICELQKQGRRVAMVGDGVNDAAALAQADVGIAMPSGTDLAREAGGVLLLYPDLRLVPQAVLLARRAVRVMRQNLAWAAVYNVLGVPIAAGLLYPHFHMLLSPVLASAAMALSSVSVLLNSLRLRTATHVSDVVPSAIH